MEELVERSVLVTGGTGTLGRHAVSILRECGHDVRVLSRRPGAGPHGEIVETWRRQTCAEYVARR